MVFEHCENVYVLDFGRVIAAGAPRDVQNHDEVRKAYLGGFVETSA
jgi:ABC-type branched-subunit amino acid transport system ATPase component